MTCQFYIPQPYKSLLFWLVFSHTQVAQVYQGLIWGLICGRLPGRLAAEPRCSYCLSFLLVIQAAKDIVTLVHVAQPLIKILIDVSVPVFRPCCPLKVSLTICCLGLMLINDECTECELLWFNRQCLDPGTLKTPLQYTKYYCNFYIHQLSLQICLAQHNPFSTPFPISFALFN